MPLRHRHPYRFSIRTVREVALAKMRRRMLLAIALGLVGSCAAPVTPPPEPPPPPPGPPQLDVTPSSVTFSDTVQTANPAPIAIAVTGSGGAVTGVSVGAVEYGTGGAGWLTALIDADAAPATLTLRASNGSLPPGTYHATVPVRSAVAGNSPRTVSVTLALSAPPPPGPGAAMLTVAGNIGACDATADDATATLIGGIPGEIFTAGDNAFPHGTASDYAGCYEPTWGREKARTHAVLGNHDYDRAQGADAFDYWGDRAGPRDKGWYSVDVGDWHVIVINDNLPFGPSSEQGAWLAADLAASTRRCTMAIWHQPLFLSSNTEGFTERGQRKPLWDALYAASVDVVVNGHQHHYERMSAMAPDGSVDETRGIRQFNVGTAGGNGVTQPLVAIHPNSEVRAASFGVLTFALYADRYDWRFVPVPGEAFSESGTGTCH